MTDGGGLVAAAPVSSKPILLVLLLLTHLEIITSMQMHRGDADAIQLSFSAAVFSHNITFLETAILNVSRTFSNNSTSLHLLVFL
jgi:hypothetical protein